MPPPQRNWKKGLGSPERGRPARSPLPIPPPQAGEGKQTTLSPPAGEGGTPALPGVALPDLARYISSSGAALNTSFALRRPALFLRNKPTNRPACRRAVWRFFHGGSVMNSNRTDHIRLTSHPEPGGKSRFPIHWGAADPHARGPIIATVSQPQRRNVIGSHGGSYALYRALAVSAGGRGPVPRPAPTN